MTEQEFELLLREPEGPRLDWKKDLPVKSPSGTGHNQAARGNLLRDIAALANGLFLGVGDTAHLVYGVKDLGSRRQVVGIGGHLDDADIQEWARNAFHQPPMFVYGEYSIGSSPVVAIVTIERSEEVAIAKRTIGALVEGQVWVRYGTRNGVAGLKELRELFKPNEPFRIGNLNDPVVNEITAAYRAAGEEMAFKRFSDRDALLTRGWRIACYPGTRREVHTVDFQGHIEHVAMLKPRP
jgi:hypothetical protein